MEKNKSIGTRSRSALLWGLLGAIMRQGSTLVITIILARLLGPEEFGLIGIALVFITLCQVFTDVGFTDGLIQRKEVTPLVYSSIFYLNLAISLALSLIVFLAAPYIGEFYNRNELPELLQWLVLIVPIAAIGKVHETQLRKQLKFKSLTIRTILSSNIGGAAGILAAYQGLGVKALVIQQLVSVGLSTILLWYSTGWRPMMDFSWKEVRLLFSFSGYVFLDHGIRQLFQRIDVLFIGKVFSPTILGYYSRAESLNFQITTYTAGLMRKVMYPVLSSVQDDAKEFERLYLKVFSLLAVLSTGLLGLLYFLAEDIILLLLGNKWLPTVVLFQILIFKTLISPFGVLMGKSMLSMGYSKEKFLVSLMHRVITLTPLIVGLYSDITTFALAVVVAFFVSFLLNAYLVDRMIKINFWKQLILFLKPLIPLLVIIAVVSILPFTIHPLIQALIFTVSFVVFLFIINDTGLNHILYEVQRLKHRIKRNQVNQGA